MRKRTKELKIRLTEEEYEEIKKVSADLGLSRQAYVLGAISGAVIIPAEDIKNICILFSDQIRQLRGMATNINQMAYIANLYAKDKTKKLPEEYILLDILEKVDEYRKEGEEAWQLIRSLLTLQKNTED